MPPTESYWYRQVSTPRYFPLLNRFFFVAGLILIIIFFNWLAPGQPNLSLRAAASLMLIVAGYPSWRWMSGHDRGLPFMCLLPMVYSLYFSIPVFLLEQFSWDVGPPLPQSWLNKAEWLALLCLVIIEFSYYVSGPFLDRFMPHPRMNWTNLVFVKFAALVLGAIGLMTYLLDIKLQIKGGAQQIIVLIGDLSLIATTILYAMALTTGLDTITKLILWFILIPSRMVLSLAAGATAYAFATPLLLLFLYASVRRRLPWGFLLAGITLIFIIRPIVAPLRQLTWQGGPLAGSSELTKLKVGADLARREVGGEVPYETLLQFMAQRLGEINSFALIAHLTPRVVPYWYGGSYSSLKYKFMPRLLFPGKPSDINFEFPHRYGLTQQSDNVTLIGDPLPEEFYENFGVWGVVFGSIIFGIMYRSIHALFVHRAMGLGALACGVYILTSFFRVEWQQAVVIGGIIYALPFLALINFFVSVGEMHDDTAPLRVHSSRELADRQI